MSVMLINERTLPIVWRLSNMICTKIALQHVELITESHLCMIYKKKPIILLSGSLWGIRDLPYAK